MILILDRNEEVQTVLTNNGSPDSCPYYTDYLKDYVDQPSTYEFYCPANHNAVQDIIVGGYVVRTDQDSKLRMFQILTIEDYHGSLSDTYKYVYAEDAGVELIDDVIRPATYSNYSATQLLQALLLGSRWQVGEVDPSFALQTFAFTDYESILTGLQSSAIQLGGEIQFRITIENGKVTGRYVDLVKQRGEVTNKRFEVGKDIQSIKPTIDLNGFASALIGVGNNDLSFKDVVWSVANGDPADKPAGQDWVGDDEALQTYGRKGKHVFNSFSVDTDDPAVLLQKTYAQLQVVKTPSITYELEVALLERVAGYEHEQVRIGDSLYVIDNTFPQPLLLQARVLELDTCFADPSQDQCVLGNFKVIQSNISAELRAVQATLLRKASSWDNATTLAQQALANSKTINITMTSSNGEVFKNGNVNTVLVVTITEGSDDVTSQLPASAFIWHKYDESGTEDMTWYTAHLGIGRSVALTYSDTLDKSTFECDVDTSTLITS